MGSVPVSALVSLGAVCFLVVALWFAWVARLPPGRQAALRDHSDLLWALVTTTSLVIVVWQVLRYRRRGPDQRERRR